MPHDAPIRIGLLMRGHRLSMVALGMVRVWFGGMFPLVGLGDVARDREWPREVTVFAIGG